ncbi:MAG TPA: metallophosphoesterase [Blastocatellia bacterium]|nr:metallophosphoesterase [Blastocatellia bacterium]
MRRVVSSAIAIVLMVTSGFIGSSRGQNGKPAAAAKEPARLSLPMKDGSVRFVVIGDTGSGAKAQHELAEVLLKYRQSFPYEFVLMMGDNLYGGESAADYKTKFEDIYKPLLDAKVKFYASLGNHDESNQRFYDHFNMNGNEYYSFKKGNAKFYALNSNYMDQKQVKWIEDELSKDTSEWKICFFHHPPYSSGKSHGSDEQLRQVVEPIFVKHGVDVVFTGHEHFYERIKPQKGIYYFISGAGGKLRSGDVKASSLTEKSFDKDLSFMLVEIVDDQMHFQVISRTGETIDQGVLTTRESKLKATTK